MVMCKLLLFSSQTNLLKYDYEKWGCPLKMNSILLEFIPELLLYDGDTFVKEVDVNFILWEQHDRTDYKYNTSMYNVRCHHRQYAP